MARPHRASLGPEKLRELILYAQAVAAESRRTCSAAVELRLRTVHERAARGAKKR
jgi:hypothetical protein